MISMKSINDSTIDNFIHDFIHDFIEEELPTNPFPV